MCVCVCVCVEGGGDREKAKPRNKAVDEVDPTRPPVIGNFRCARARCAGQQWTSHVPPRQRISRASAIDHGPQWLRNCRLSERHAIQNRAPPRLKRQAIVRRVIGTTNTPCPTLLDRTTEGLQPKKKKKRTAREREKTGQRCRRGVSRSISIGLIEMSYTRGV